MRRNPRKVRPAPRNPTTGRARRTRTAEQVRRNLRTGPGHRRRACWAGRRWGGWGRRTRRRRRRRRRGRGPCPCPCPCPCRGPSPARDPSSSHLRTWTSSCGGSCPSSGPGCASSGSAPWGAPGPLTGAGCPAAVVVAGAGRSRPGDWRESLRSQPRRSGKLPRTASFCLCENEGRRIK